MAITLKIPVGQVSGSNWQPVTTYTNLNLRASPYSAATYTQEVGNTNGIYTFLSVASGEYKLYDSTTELTNFGIIKVGQDDAVLITGNQTIAGVKTFSSQADFSNASGLKTDVIAEHTAAAGVTIDGILLKDSLDLSGIVSKSGSQQIDGDKTFTGNVNIDSGGAIFTIEGGGVGIIVDAPTADTHIVNKAYADSLAITPFQQSPNVRRLIINGTQETNKVYTTWTSCMTNAYAYAASNYRMTIMVEGIGTAATTITIGDAGGGVGFINDYITVRGISQQQIRLTPPDDTISVTTLGNTSFENLTMYLHDTAQDPIFTNIVFNNVLFDLDVNSVTFNTCEFRNCTIKVTTGSPTFTSCKGSGVYTTGSFGSSPINGTDSISSSDIA